MHRRPHWSYSSITQYLTCPLRYYFQRILCLPQPTVGSGLVLGSAVHAALARYHIGIQDGKGSSRDEIQRAYSDSWNQRDDSVIAYKDSENRQGLFDQGMALVDLYLTEPPPERIVAVEKEIISPVQNSRGEYLETPLLAVADLIVATDDGLVVRELKTSARAYSTGEAAASLQPTCYVNAVEEAYGEPTMVEYTVLVKTKQPKIQRLDAKRATEDLGRLGDIIETVERAVQAEIFYPSPSVLHCSTCPYQEPCREWGRPKIPAESLLPVVAVET